MTAAEPTFVDTNALVYADQPASLRHREARNALIQLAATNSELWISRQVLREYAATMTRPAANGVSPLTRVETAQAIEDFSERFLIAEDGPEVTARLNDLLRSVDLGGKQVHDANIVATMQEHGISRLLTYNPAHLRRYASIIMVIDPAHFG